MFSGLVNGQPTDSIAATDRGLLYGDGVFRTLRIAHGAPLWWGEQFAKLTADCDQLSIPAPTAAEWQADLAQIPVEDGVLKLIVTRGPGARGYAQPVPCRPTRILQWSPLPSAEADAVHARWCDLRLALQPALAGAKHLNRLEQVLARAEWRNAAIGEGLLRDSEGFVVSGVMSNLFVLQGTQWLTPLLDRCGVAGVARARLMRLAVAAGFGVTEARIRPEALLTADAVLLCNSVRGLRWLAQLDDLRWTEPPHFAKWQEVLWRGA